jgi:adenylate cyclase
VADEIERKFLLETEPEWLGECESSEIEQGYLALEPEVEVRVRRRDGAGRLTVKRGAGERREEVEVELDGGQLERLWPLTEGRRLRKRRYLVPLEVGTAEVDVYRGPHAGLITAEIEFESERQAAEAELPRWIGREVTGVPAYANRALAVAGEPSA